MRGREARTGGFVGTSATIRWAGLAAVVGGGLRVAGHLTDPGLLARRGFDPFYDVYLPAALVTLGSLLLLGGLAGLHLREARAYGRLGAAGFLLTSAGTLAGAALGFAQALSWIPISTAVIAATVTSGFVGTAGLLLLGIALLSRGDLPWPWGAMPLAIFAGEIISVLLSFVPPLTPVAEALIGLCWMALGYALFSGKGENAPVRTAPQP